MSEETQEPQERGWSAAQMLAELDLPVTVLRPAHAEIQQEFVAVVDPAIGLIMGADPKAEGESQFAVRQLLVRGINDAVAAFHLAAHGYLNQAYNAMRMGYEAADIIDLVASSPDEGHLWVNSQRPWHDFSPGNVRERLGKERLDEIYSHLCEMSHPRFTASRLTGFAKRTAEPDGTTSDELVIHFGPFPLDDHPAFLFAVGFLNSTAATVVLRTHHLVTVGAVSETAWEQAMKNSLQAQQRLVLAVAAGLQPFGLDASPAVELYESRPEL
jgi:hypothetical protein